jgi:hypothetical protein
VNARIASLLAALGITGVSVGTVNGRLPEDTKALVTAGLVALAGWVAPSAIRIPDPYKAQLLSVVAVLVGGLLDWLVVQSTAGSTTAAWLVGIITFLAGLLVPATHLHNAPPDTP